MKTSMATNNPTQHRSWILGIRRRVAGAGLALAIMLVPAVVAIASAQAQTYSVVYTFAGPDGAGPDAGLVLDTQGNLYGTTANGGGALACSGGVLGHGCGTVFKVDKTGNETVLHRFTKAGGEGANPVAGLVLEANGNLYGTTANGGDSSCAVGFGRGCGTVFKVTP